ncbi:hypothetical protein LZZ85_17760 [Terrimonas sp. NA20]|uniref:Uncharacterized protein n=1 Tax=Terrimonas ginsenosidimutans TaxID=2908004 RepID=A0ABS9KV07_9BACT|nr:hypothetical protein [Terrimonas ginsenosidimutans]MCG2616148.1 hypothetical protein [Terrimonas ginsenosidimutans]
MEEKTGVFVRENAGRLISVNIKSREMIRKPEEGWTGGRTARGNWLASE